MRRFIAAALLTGIALVAVPSAAQAYTLSAEEARIISTSESDLIYKFRGVQAWGPWADDQATGYQELRFERLDDTSVRITARRQWFGCNVVGSGAPCGQPDMDWTAIVYEYPNSTTIHYSIYGLSQDQPSSESWFPLSADDYIKYFPR